MEQLKHFIDQYRYQIIIVLVVLLIVGVVFG